jgi:hypothetical protein
MATMTRQLAGAMATAALALLTAGPAAADDTGQTYAQAQAALNGQGYTVIQSTSIGDQLPQSECLVVKQLTSANGHVMLSLNCNKKPASAGGR